MTPDESDGKTAEGLSAADRKALLKRAVHDLTREARAGIRKKGEFEAILVRGRPVNHRLHLVAMIVLGGLTALTLRYWTNYWYIATAVVATIGYALLWLFLTVTGGEQLERISVDEAGKVTSVKSGRDPGKRGDYERVVFPLIVIAVSGWLVVGLTRDIAFPPHPACAGIADTDPCWVLPHLGDNGKPQLPSVATSVVPSVAPSVAPSVVPSVGPSGLPGATVDQGQATLNVAQTKLVERAVRVFQLLIALAFLLSGIWFLRRMLTGRWVLTVGPVGHRGGDD